ncbi:MAG: hypothetical protein SFY67_04290 [Candidatus Melainabacteria bacterium]|nr:hypothetical protein [Candidatus Melainabacteria bacterium]
MNLSQDIIQKIETSSVNLVKLDDENCPVRGNGSGCLIDYGGKRYLLTVKHVITDENPSLVIGWDQENRKTLVRKLTGERTAVQGVLGEGATDFDGIEFTSFQLAYFEHSYSDVPLFQKVDQSGKVLESKACFVFSEDSMMGPKENVLYGFGGHTRASLESHKAIADDVLFRFTEFRICYALTYEGMKGDFPAFKLPGRHPGDEYFRGCSGSPIIDMHGNVAALVNHGDVDEGLIYGVPIEKYKMLLMTEKLLNQFNETGKPYLE